MCWSGEASAVLAVIGLSTTAYAAYKKQPAALWMTLGYFSLMELLQAFTYAVIDQCGDPLNEVATLLGFIHIAFQPFFINAISMHFIDAEVRRKISPIVYTLCLASTIFMIIQLYPMAWAGTCTPIRPLCGPELCSVSGDWHIAWDLPLNGIGNHFAGQGMWSILLGGFFTYFWVSFFLPLLYGSWRFTTYHILVGPTLSWMLTTNPNEWAAVWCLLSIGILILVVKTPLRGYLYVKKWPLWRFLK